MHITYRLLAIAVVLAVCGPTHSQHIQTDRSSLDYKLLRACARRDTNTIIDLIESGADVNTTRAKVGIIPNGKYGSEFCPLHEFAKSNHAVTATDAKRVIDTFKTAQANFEQADTRDRTAIYFAVENQDTVLVRLLLDVGADPNIKTNSHISCADEVYGVTPLHIASRSNEVWDLLVKHGANVDATDSHGETPQDWRRAEIEAREFGLQ